MDFTLLNNLIMVREYSIKRQKKSVMFIVYNIWLILHFLLHVSSECGFNLAFNSDPYYKIL